MAEYRNILADGDLIRQRKGVVGWWLFGESKWKPFRNLSREVRYLEERMHAAHAAYKAAQEDYVVAHKNVAFDKDLLMKYKGANSEVSYEMPSDESILSRRDGIKYNSSNNNQQKQKQSGGSGNGNNQQNNQGGNDKGNGNNQNQNQNQSGKQRGGRRQSLLGLLANAEVTVH
jgi:hypothetical protein